MIVINLTNNRVAVIDDADVAFAGLHEWRAVRSKAPGDSWYATTTIGGRTVYLHRLLLGLTHGDRTIVDHRDGDGLNNRRGNLRVATSAQSNAHRRRHSRGRCQFKGVSFDKQTGHWKAQIGHGGRNHHLGRFATAEEAAAAYDAAAHERFGEFALTNGAMNV